MHKHNSFHYEINLLNDNEESSINNEKKDDHPFENRTLKF